MNSLLLLFTMKLLDTAIGTLKNIFMVKNKPFLSAVASSISYLFYILLMKQLISSTTVATVSVTLLAVFLGQYVTQIMTNKMDKDKVWKISITPASKEESLDIADKLKEANIAIQTYSCYTSDKTKVLGINAFSESKENSSVISSILEDYKVKTNITEIKNRF